MEFVKSADLLIDIKHKDVLKITANREEAKKNNQLFSASKDWVNATASYNGEKYRISMRLKGVMPSHWPEDGYWSYKIKVKDN